MTTRIWDIFFSIAALLMLSPLFLIVILLLSVTGEREVFYRQRRVGIGGTDFYLIKFATMLKNSPNIGAGTVTVQNDPRVLPLGHFLRNSKINELPQLINVIKGEMSLVGHRPLVRKAYEKYPIEVRESIDNGLPGLSGLGSLVFRREEQLLHQLENAEDFYYETILPYKGTLEAWYQRHQRFSSYFSIIFLTILGLISSRVDYLWKVFPDAPQPPESLCELLGLPARIE